MYSEKKETIEGAKLGEEIICKAAKLWDNPTSCESRVRGDKKLQNCSGRLETLLIFLSFLVLR